MSTRSIKKDVISILQETDLASIMNRLTRYPDKDLIGPLFSALCRIEVNIRWHAVTVLGNVVARMAEYDTEAARIIMRRFLWSLNDESGGIGWGAPEAMGVTMVHSETLFSEYNHMLISYMREDGPEPFQDGNYLELPQLQVGLLWGLCQLLQHRKQSMLAKGILVDIPPYLYSINPEVRGMAAWCLDNLGVKVAEERLAELILDDNMMTLYSEGVFSKRSVGYLAGKALESMNV